MALPSGIATKLVTLGKYYGADGTLSNNWTATVTIDRELRWVATGDVIEPTTMPITRDSLGGASVRLPNSDQAGFVDSAGSPVTGWYYTITITSPDFVRKPRTFQLPASATDPFDADNVPVASFVPTIVSGDSYVTTVTVNGVTQTGAVVLDLGNLGGPVGQTTVGGITDASALGQSLLRAVDANSALTVLGIQSLAATVNSQAAAIASLSSQVSSLQTALTQGLQGKLDASTVGVSVAPLDGSRKLPVANLPPAVPVMAGDGSATVPVRPATTNPVIFNDTTAPPTGGTTAGGTAAAAPIDIWWG